MISPLQRALNWHHDQKATAIAAIAAIDSGTTFKERTTGTVWRDITQDIRANNERIIRDSDEFIAHFERLLAEGA